MDTVNSFCTFLLQLIDYCLTSSNTYSRNIHNETCFKLFWLIRKIRMGEHLDSNTKTHK